MGELAVVCGLRDAECRAITLAVDEALTNIIRHAYHGDFTRTIELNCQAGAGKLEFKLLDQGEPPDPIRLRPHALDAVALGGRGTHIIRSIMDEVCYERVPAGNLLKLSKQLPESRGGEEKEKSYERCDS